MEFCTLISAKTGKDTSSSTKLNRKIAENWANRLKLDEKIRPKIKLSAAVPINRDPGRIRADCNDKRQKIYFHLKFSFVSTDYLFLPVTQ